MYAIRSYYDFKNGYIITANQDTIYGYVNNNSYYDNSQFCEFKTSKNDSVIKYTPKELFGYRFIDGKFYISKKLRKKTCFLSS